MCAIDRALNPSKPQLLSFGPSRGAQFAFCKICMTMCRRENPQQSEAYAVKAVGCWGQAYQAAWGDLLDLI